MLKTLDSGKGNSSTGQQQNDGNLSLLRCIFKYKDIPVEVNNPFFRIKAVSGKEYLPFKAVDTYPINQDETIWALEYQDTYYQIKLDPASVDLGWHEIYFEGDIKDGGLTQHIVIKGTIEIVNLDKASRIVSYVMNMLADDDIEAYVITAGQWHHFKASSLMNFVPLGIKFINTTGIQSTNFTIDTLPENYEIFLIEWIFAKAMLQKARVMIDNDLQISDSKSLMQNKYEKYKALYDSELQQVKAGVESYKRATPPMAFGQVRAKYPLYMIYRGVSAGTRTFYLGGMNVNQIIA